MRLTTNPVIHLAELVNRPSVSPGGESAGTTTGEALVADYAARYLKRLGAEVEIKMVQSGRPNVLAVFESSRKAKATVALVPHLDTVGVADMSVSPFRLTRRGDKLHGRGTCDTKGPFAALLAALTSWSRSAPRGDVRWVVAATMGEESGGIGAEALVRSGFRPDFAIALEPTGLKIVHANKGILRVWLEARGRAAHGSQPDRGINAISQLWPVVRKVETSLTSHLGRRIHPLLGPATVNIGAIVGGDEVNVVPARCRVGLDIRTHPDCSATYVLARLKNLIRTVPSEIRLDVSRLGAFSLTSKTHPWAMTLRRSARGWAVAPWFCDANQFAAVSVPSVAFGPGSIHQAHTHDEYISTSSLQAGVAAFRSLLSRCAP